MDIERRCSWCGKTFIAHNYGTRYCCPSCRRDAKRSNAKKVKAVAETTKCQVPEIGLVGNKPFLSPKDEVGHGMSVNDVDDEQSQQSKWRR